MVLSIHERTVAASLERELKPIPQADVDRAVSDCDKDKDGKLSKEEMNNWLIKYLKTHEHYKHEHQTVLKKITSIKSPSKVE